MCCPCVHCQNKKDYSNTRTIHAHLLRSGFMPSYNCWTKHGEKGVVMEDNEEEEDDDNYHNMYPEYDDTTTGVDNEDQEASDVPTDDDLGRAITDANEECQTEKEKEKLEQMLKDHKTLLYPTCEDGHKNLGATLDLLQWKAENGVTDSAFSKWLVKMKNPLPRNNELPDSTYQAKKVVCPLGLDVQKIHASINDCTSTAVRSTRILMHARYALHCGIRSDETILAMLRARPLGRRFPPRLCGMLL